MSYVHSGSVLFQKQRVLCAEHAQTKSAPKPLQNTLHGKRALGTLLHFVKEGQPNGALKRGSKTVQTVEIIHAVHVGRFLVNYRGCLVGSVLECSHRVVDVPLNGYVGATVSQYFSVHPESLNINAASLFLKTYPHEDVAAQLSSRHRCLSSAALLAVVIVPNMYAMSLSHILLGFPLRFPCVVVIEHE